jgi:AmiR/NasT family two-component response regulator
MTTVTTALLRWAADSPALVASTVPTVVLDDTFKIWGVNPGYEEVSLRSGETLKGEEVFAAFPDNPHDPAGAGSVRLQASLERVFRSRRRHHMGLLRYDIADPDRPDVYLPRVWTSVNSPILLDRRVIGVMQQVEDVTPHTYATWTEPSYGKDPVSHLAVAISTATATMTAMEEEINDLRGALTSSRTIGVAIGLLMARLQISRDQAFELLRLGSQHSNRKVRDIAEYMADTGQLPEQLPLTAWQATAMVAESNPELES